MGIDGINMEPSKNKIIITNVRLYFERNSRISTNSIRLNPGNEKFMNVLSKRNSVHLRMTHVQFVHVHFLTPTPGQRSFSSFISFSSFRLVHFV